MLGYSGRGMLLSGYFTWEGMVLTVLEYHEFDFCEMSNYTQIALPL